MEWLADFHFIRPLWLIALVPVGLLAYFLYRHLARASSWQKAIDPALIPFLLVKPPLSPSMNPLPLLVLAWIIAILALAGPTQEKVPQPILEREDALVIVLDLTWSMYAADLSPSRLVTAKRKITDLLNGREEGMTALISFAGDAHTVAPLTDDTGSRLFVYVHKEGDISFCAVSVQQQQTPLFSLLASVIQLAALGESSNLLSTAIQLLCRHLAPPSVGTALRVAFTPAGVCNLACQVGANAPASQLPAADELLYDVIGCLGLSQALE